MMEVANRKHPIQTLVTSVPIIMLMIGLYVFYRTEQQESAGLPVLEESVAFEGEYRGVSVVQSGGDGRHYLWFDTDARTRGPRITLAQSLLLQELQTGDAVEVHMAPHVPGSRTFWAWRVDAAQGTLFDDTAGVEGSEKSR